MQASQLNGTAMRVQFTLRHAANNAAVESYSRAAVAEFNKYFDGVTDCHIILDHQTNDRVLNKLAEITAHVYQHTFVSKEAAETYEKAVDACVTNICKQLQKHKEKVRHL